MEVPLNNQGLPVIADENFLRQKYDNVSRSEKVLAYGKSLIREVLTELTIRMTRITPPSFRYFKYHDCDEPIKWKSKSKGIIAFVHGFDGHPAIFNPQLSWLENAQKMHPEYQEYDVFVPYVPYAGRCELEDAAEPIFDQLQDYRKKHPDTPICLVGFSQGALIVDILDTMLPGTTAKVSTTGGIHFGSRMIDFAEKIGLADFYLHPVTCEELRYGSEKAKSYLTSILKKRPPATVRSYDFFASTEDLMASSLNSACPQLGVGEHVGIKHNFGHNSSVAAFCDEQMQRCMDFMEEHQRKLKVM